MSGCVAFTLTGPCVFPSQSDIGFGKLETYVKLDKLGEVRGWAGGEEQGQALPCRPVLPYCPCPVETYHLGHPIWPSLLQALRGARVLEEGMRMAWGPWALGIIQFVCFSCKYFSGFESCLCHLLSLWPWASYVTSLCLFFFFPLSNGDASALCPGAVTRAGSVTIISSHARLHRAWRRGRRVGR